MENYDSAGVSPRIGSNEIPKGIRNRRSSRRNSVEFSRRRIKSGRKIYRERRGGAHRCHVIEEVVSRGERARDRGFLAEFEEAIGAEFAYRVSNKLSRRARCPLASEERIGFVLRGSVESHK